MSDFHTQYSYLDSTSRAFFASYKTGSRWIYQIEGTNQFDTTTETYSQTAYDVSDSLINQNIRLCYETFQISYECQVGINFYTIALTLEGSQSKKYSFEVYYNIAGGLSVEESNNTFYPISFVQSDTKVSMLDSLQVLNHTFKNVLCLKAKGSNGYDEIDLAKNIGIVKKTDYKRTYLLKEWLIKK